MDIPKFPTADMETYECISCPTKGLQEHLKNVHSNIEQGKFVEENLFFNKQNKQWKNVFS